MQCPQCGSARIWKDGLRPTTYDDVQRYLCRSCGYRFSQPRKKLSVQSQTRTFQPRSNLAKSTIRNGNLPAQKSLNDLSLSLCEDVGSHNVTFIGKDLNNLRSYSCKHQVCVNEKKMKNLVKVETRTKKRSVGDTKTNLEDLRGKIVEYAWWMRKEGYRDSTVNVRTRYLQQLMRLGANLLQPNCVKEVVAQKEWSETFKATVMSTYKSFAEMLGMKVGKTKYRKEHKLLFIPTEREIDQLIAGCGKRTATFLQTLKETGMRCGEAWQLKWINVDTENHTITVNNPEKHGQSQNDKSIWKTHRHVEKLTEKT